MKLKRTNLIIFIALITFLFFLAPSLFGLFLKITPLIIIAIVVSFFIKKSPNRKTLESESIFNKRIKKFKSIKRGYYSLIIIIKTSSRLIWSHWVIIESSLNHHWIIIGPSMRHYWFVIEPPWIIIGSSLNRHHRIINKSSLNH